MLAFVVLLLFGSLITSCESILNGERVLKVKYPYLVQLKIWCDIEIDDGLITRLFGRCGGTIISTKSILTAAHCIEDTITEPKIQIHAGKVYANTLTEKGQSANMAKFIIHPDYISNNIDLAFIYLDSRFTVTPGLVEAATLTAVGQGNWIKIAGWGYMTFNQNARVLQEAYMKVVMNSLCMSYRFGVTNFLCIIDPSYMRTFCGGDSGGPAIYHNKVAGVIIESDSEVVRSPNGTVIYTCSPQLPAIAVNLFQHDEWIKDNTKQ